MNKKQNILVMKNDAARQKPSPVKISFLRKAAEIKPGSDAFAVDWQLDTAGTTPENIFSGGRHHPATGQTNGWEWHTLSFLLSSRLKTNT